MKRVQIEGEDEGCHDGLRCVKVFRLLGTLERTMSSVLKCRAVRNVTRFLISSVANETRVWIGFNQQKTGDAANGRGPHLMVAVERWRTDSWPDRDRELIVVSFISPVMHVWPRRKQPRGCGHSHQVREVKFQLTCSP